MAKPRVFISSTFYDLRQIRTDLDLFIESLGYEPIRNEEGDIPYGRQESLEEYCYKEIKSVDIVISVIGGRYGTESRRSNSSISQIELKTAFSEEKQVYIFIEKNVLSEYETYLLNKEEELMKYRYVDNIKIYKFIEEVKSLDTNNNIKGFETAADITKYLKEQFAGLFQRFLEEQTRIKESSLIKNLEKTAQTLNKLVNFLSKENQGNVEEINRILMINHPLVETLRSELKIDYNFYIEGVEDLNKFLYHEGFEEVLPWNDEGIVDDDYYVWISNQNRKRQILNVSSFLFDFESKLKYIKKTDWNSEFVKIQDLPIDEYVKIKKSPVDEDELPF